MLQDQYNTAWDAAGLSAEASPYATTAESISEGISSALTPLEGAVEALDGAMGTVNDNLASFEEYEMQEFSNINDNVFPSYPTLRPALGSLKNLNNILQLAIDNPAGTLLTIAKNQYVQMTAGLGFVTLGTYGLEKMATADLNSTDTTSNGTDASQETRIHYIKFIQNFPLLLLNILTKTLDGDAGVKVAAVPAVNELGPGYSTELVVGPAKLMKYLPFITFIYVHPTYEQMLQPGYEYLSMQQDAISQRIPGFLKSNSAHNKRDYIEGLGYWHQEAMSRQKGVASSLQRYRREESQGSGITIFVVDSGFNLGSIFNGVSDVSQLRIVHSPP